MSLKINNKIKRLVFKRFKNISHFSKVLNIHSETVRNWINGINFPPLDSQYKIAEILNIHVDELREPSNVPDYKDLKFTPEELDDMLGDL